MAANRNTRSVAASQQKQIDALKTRITFLHGEHQQTHRELEAALERNVRLQETIRVLSGLLNEADGELTTRRQLDGENQS